MNLELEPIFSPAIAVRHLPPTNTLLFLTVSEENLFAPQSVSFNYLFRLLVTITQLFDNFLQGYL